ncbi:MAG: PilN family type IVB pilus formation outer membrane protein [Polaromonas sp.]|uniref:PilN family type IVB pilus formation outer membrane protein n=1 Tax=Polaromonas sp. TaxID=1869339 RepID=UPI0024888B40|nr:PilN family type IVB pilus formation outer membrane protein [Polaromonas sp.]MDI1236338.1 PilN family type IVB pilus formation outer membrane protein [Polaromonas sp.]
MKTIASLLAIATLAGCTAPTQQVKSIEKEVSTAKVQAEQMLTRRVEPVETSPVSYSDQSWIPLRKVERLARDEASAKADTIQIEINQRFASLNEVAGVISSLTGLPVYLGSDIPTTTAATAGAAAAGAPMPAGMPFPMGAPGGVMPTPMPAGIGGIPTAAQAGPITANSPFMATYSGSLSGLMNLVSAYYGVNWKGEAQGLRFFVMDSKTYRIAALPGDTRLNSSVDSSSNASAGGTGSGASSGATQTGTSTNSTGVGFSGLSVWSALESGIKQMLSTGGRVIASPATGTITVTDTPSVLARVTEYINGQNSALNRQVSVNVRVLSVELTDGDNYGINWDAVYSNLASASNPFSVALKTAFPVASGAGNIIISAPATSASRWAGSSAMISALSTQGRVSELTSSTLVTLNNQPAPVNVGRRVSYLASSSTTQTANVGATTALTPGTVQTGFSMTLVPHIIDGKEMLLQYSLDLSSLLRLSTITSGTSSIQAPDISTSNFIQRVRIQSGETLVVAGFDQDNLSAVSNGIGSAENAALGSRNGTRKRTMLVVLIQPNIAL